jgi:hypothetical protein
MEMSWMSLVEQKPVCEINAGGGMKTSIRLKVLVRGEERWYWAKAILNPKQELSWSINGWFDNHTIQQKPDVTHFMYPLLPIDTSHLRK